MVGATVAWGQELGTHPPGQLQQEATCLCWNLKPRLLLPRLHCPCPGSLRSKTEVSPGSTYAFQAGNPSEAAGSMGGGVPTADSLPVAQN